MNACLHGMRVRGDLRSRRTRIDWRAADAGYRACSSPELFAEEAYLSAYVFPDEFAAYLAENGSPAGYSGPAWATAVLWDIDREELGESLQAMRNLVAVLEETFDVPCEAIDVFFSGRKGFHIVVPTLLWASEPSVDFPATCRLFAEAVAAEAKVEIDSSIYGRVHMVRAINSVHPKTRLHKVLVPAEGLDVAGVLALAEVARPTRPLAVTATRCVALQECWDTALSEVARQREAAQAARSQDNRSGGSLTRVTMAVLRGEGLAPGSRHRLVYSAAANLAECGAPLELTEQLLMDVARESGLPPRDALRQIRDGHRRGWEVGE